MTLVDAQLNLSTLGFSFLFHDKAKRTQQGDLLGRYKQWAAYLYNENYDMEYIEKEIRAYKTYFI